MTRLFAVLALAAGLLLAACGGTGSSAGTSLEPISSDAPSVEVSPELSPDVSMSPEASPS